MALGDNEEIYKRFAPTQDEHFRDIFFEWVRDFHDQYLACENEAKRATELKLQVTLFHVKPNQFDTSINPDISGNLIKSIIDSTEILRRTASDRSNSSQGRQKKSPEALGQGGTSEMAFGKLKFAEENCKILMELLRVTGRDTDVLGLYDAFKAIYENNGKPEKKSSQ